MARNTQVNWRISERAKEAVRLIAEKDMRSHGAVVELLILAEAKKRGLTLPPEPNESK